MNSEVFRLEDDFTFQITETVLCKDDIALTDRVEGDFTCNVVFHPDDLTQF